MERLTLRHPRGTTVVLAGRGALEAAGAELAPWLGGRTVFLLTSPRVEELWGEAIAGLTAPSARLIPVALPEGERAKRLAVAEQVWERMSATGGRRDSRLLCFGGGSVGDLGGFVAGAFQRGIEYAQIPTTLLAQVDAAIGGKTAVDLETAKNAVGLFHHPAMVVAEPRFLASLPPRERRAGLVEIVKIAAAADRVFLERLESRLTALLAGDEETLAEVVPGAIAAKIRVVESDPEEQGRRRLLNLGHTLGHALEAATGYELLSHGEAVVHGLRFAIRLAGRRGADERWLARLEALLAGLEPPPLPAIPRRQLFELIERDKKAGAAGVRWVLPMAPGAAEVVEGMDEALVATELEAFLREAVSSRA